MAYEFINKNKFDEKKKIVCFSETFFKKTKYFLNLKQMTNFGVRLCDGESSHRFVAIKMMKQAILMVETKTLQNTMKFSIPRFLYIKFQVIYTLTKLDVF